MTNSVTNRHRRRALHGLAVLLLIAITTLGGACGETHGGDGSSGSHWLVCDDDDECSDAQDGASCGSEGYCVDSSGQRIASAPLSAAGGSGGSDAGADAGADSGSADAGSAPLGCNGFTVGDECEASSDVGWPECCAHGTVLACVDVWCLDSDPGWCTGTVGPREGAEACVAAPHPDCAGKQCGDICEPCDPMDPECMPGLGLFSCDPDGTCRRGIPRCPTP